MRPLVLYIACRLDGYIARNDGGIDWLFADRDYGYRDFFAGLDTLLMGRKTYELSLSFGDDVYEGRQSFVFTRMPRPSNRNYAFITADIASFIDELKRRPGRTIWLVGGADITEQCVRHGLIDEYRIFVHPIILGQGIPLFRVGLPETLLELADSKHFDTGLVELNYRRPAPKLG